MSIHSKFYEQVHSCLISSLLQSSDLHIPSYNTMLQSLCSPFLIHIYYYYYTVLTVPLNAQDNIYANTGFKMYISL